MGQLNTRLPDELLECLRTESARTEVPQSRIVKRALEQYLGAEKGSEQRGAQAPASPDEPTVRRDDRRTPQEPSERPYKCPSPGCKVTMKSPAGTCPMHGRKVVPA